MTDEASGAETATTDDSAESGPDAVGGEAALTQGVTWWDGSAFWWGVAISEYQTLDMTWLARAPWLFAAMAETGS